jgi:hypothetical protein
LLTRLGYAEEWISWAPGGPSATHQSDPQFKLEREPFLRICRITESQERPLLDSGRDRLKPPRRSQNAFDGCEQDVIWHPHVMPEEGCSIV